MKINTVHKREGVRTSNDTSSEMQFNHLVENIDFSDHNVEIRKTSNKSRFKTFSYAKKWTMFIELTEPNLT